MSLGSVVDILAGYVRVTRPGNFDASLINLVNVGDGYSESWPFMNDGSLERCRDRDLI